MKFIPVVLFCVVSVGVLAACDNAGHMGKTAQATIQPLEAPPVQQTQKGKDMSIKDGTTVSIDYTLTVDGEVVDSSEGRGPLTYVQGQHQIIPGLEQALVGLKAGDTKSVTVPPAEAYGENDPTAVQEVPKTQLPEGFDAKPGMTLAMQTPTGQQVPVKIKDVGEENITLDLNHPLAGKTLNFDVTVVEVK